MPLVEVGPVNLEEHLEQPAICEPHGIEDDLDDLGMTGVVLLGRIVGLAAHESGTGGDDAFRMAQELLHDPCAATGENRSLGVVAHHRSPSSEHRAGYGPGYKLINARGLAHCPREVRRGSAISLRLSRWAGDSGRCALPARPPSRGCGAAHRPWSGPGPPQRRTTRAPHPSRWRPRSPEPPTHPDQWPFPPCRPRPSRPCSRKPCCAHRTYRASRTPHAESPRPTERRRRR
jgi:hypothetical protein